MTQKLLLQKSSGCVYHYSDALAADPDFVDYQPSRMQAEPNPEPVAVEAEAPPDAKTMARAVLSKKK